MKNKLIYGLLSLLVLFAACEEEEKDGLLESATVSADVSEVTIFDSPFDVKFSVSNSGVKLFKLEGGVDIDRDITVSDQTATTNFTSVDFGDDWKIGSSLSLSTSIDYGSHKSVANHSIKIIDAITATEASTIYEYDSIPSYIDFKAKTMVNGLGNVVVEKKVITEADPTPTFAELKNETSSETYAFNDSVFGVDFNELDTIVYKITATSGSFTESKMIKVPVAAKSLSSETSGELSTTSPSYDIMKDAGKISFVSTSDTRGFTSADIEFTKVAVGSEFDKEEDMFNFSRVVEVVENATLTNSVDNVVISDKFAYKFSYMDNIMYGIITINEVKSAEIGDTQNSISFSFIQDTKYSK